MDAPLQVEPGEPCPQPECTDDQDCENGNSGDLLDDILETTTPLG